MRKTTSVLCLWALVLSLARSASGDLYAEGSWTGIRDIAGDYTGVVRITFEGVPHFSYVTGLDYTILLDDRGDEDNFWCSDYKIWTQGYWFDMDLIWDRAGGKTDRGADDDVEDDSDIYIEGHSIALNGGFAEYVEVVAQDRVAHIGKDGLGRLTYVKMRVSYRIIGSDLLDAGEEYSSFTPRTVHAGQNGQNFEVTCKVQNQGYPVADAGPFAVSFYLSTDAQAGPGDYHLGDINVAGLANDQSTDVHLSRSFPADFGPPGSYYVVWKIDSYDNVQEGYDGAREAVESNNGGCKGDYQLSVLGLVPAVLGVTQSDAEAAIVAAGLRVGTVWVSPSATVPQGRVVSQNPVAGTWVAGGSQVELTVSSGPDTGESVVVPDVTDLSQAKAQAAITAVGLVVGTITQSPGPAVPQGQVISQDPAPGTQVARGSPVNLTLSTGSAPTPVAHWKLDETAGVIAADSSGNNYQGILFGGPVWQPAAGKVGGALALDGVNDYVYCANPPKLAIRDRIALACWVKVAAFTKNWETILAKGDDSYRLTRSCGTGTGNGNAIRFGLSGTSAQHVDGTVVVADNAWHHVAGVYDGSQAILYVDGVLDKAVPATGRINASTYPLYLGENSQWPGRCFNGLVDDVRIYDCALSGAEVAQLAGTARHAADIIWVSDTIDYDLDDVPDDQQWVTWLGGQGYSVDIQRGYWNTLDDAKIARLNAVDLVIVGLNAITDKYADPLERAQWNALRTPVIVLHPGLAASNPGYPGWRWLNCSTFSQLIGPPMEVLDRNHPIFAGITLDANSRVAVVEGTTPAYRVPFASTLNVGSGKVLAKTATAPCAWIVEWQPGSEFYPGSGQTPAGKRLLFCAGTSPQAPAPYGAFNLTTQGQKMFLNAVAYMIGKSATGGAVPVENFSFELPGTVKIKGWNREGVGGTPAVDIPGWRSDTAAADSGVQKGSTPTEGLWTGFLKGGDPAVWQLTDHTIAAGEVFELKVDARSIWNATMLLAVLYYDLGGVRVPAGIQVVSVTDTMQEYTVPFDAATAPASVGRKIGIEFTNVTPDATSYVGIDNVRLELVE